MTRRVAIERLFERFGRELAEILDSDTAPSDTPEERRPRKITEMDKARADRIARRLGR